ncbi:glycine betaine ABC transporter substrate-binding protein [Kineosporia babensis]|uniref:Glycine betaine ABC transporter substrate-binding protein n=1 Tax=Kineosporia babensis TaxID=499548 RepID=A0A9X1NN00_9ACTN|nr:glycine betaine ABC transporter substrate-binding protein [Kineosporia babensis]MCD5316504.1 glycine betaine ABC transporter substrate-binding protein [Kineosporia babensis]
MASLSRRALFGGLLAAGTATVAACSGEPARFQGGSGSRADDAGSGSSGSKSLSIAVIPGWDDAVASSNLWKVLLEERGYTVDLRELEVAATYTAVANNQIDIYMSTWLPGTHEPYWAKYQDDLEILSEWAEGGLMLVVPDYVQIDSVAELAAQADAFGNRIVGIEAGAGQMRLTREEVMPAYGLDGFTLVEGSTPAMLAELNSAISRQQNIVVTLWTPHWAFGRWDLKVLEEPEKAYGAPDTLTAIAGKGFSQAQPEVAGWLKNFTIDEDKSAELMAAIQDAGTGNALEGTKEWVADNKAITDAWFTSAADAA